MAFFPYYLMLVEKIGKAVWLGFFFDSNVFCSFLRIFCDEHNFWWNKLLHASWMKIFILCFQLLTLSSQLNHCMVSIYVEKFVKCVKPYHHFTTSQCLSFNRRMCGARAPLRWKRVTHATHYLSIIVLGFSFNSFYTYHLVFTGIRRNVAVWRHTRMHACSMCMLRRICNLTLRAHIFFGTEFLFSILIFQNYRSVAF